MASDLTRPQRDMLELLCGESTNPRAARTWWDGTHLLTMLYQHHRHVQGVHMTAASLVHRGFAEKRKYPKSVIYRITNKGREMVAALRSIDKAAGR